MVDGGLCHRLRGASLAAFLRPQQAEEVYLSERRQLRDRPSGGRLHLGPGDRGRGQLPQLRGVGGQRPHTRCPRKAESQGPRRPDRPAVSQLRPGVFRPQAGRPLHCRTLPIREGGRHAATPDRPPAQRPHERRQARLAHAHGVRGRKRPRPRPRRGGGEPLEVLAHHGDLRGRRRRPEWLRPHRRPPHRRAGDQPLDAARRRRLEPLFDEFDAADDRADPRPRADVAVRRRGAADDPLVRQGPGARGLRVPAGHRAARRAQRGRRLGGEAIARDGLLEGGCGRRPAAQRDRLEKCPRG